MKKLLASNNVHIALNAVWIAASVFVAAFKPGAGSAAQVSSLLALVNLLLHMYESKV